MSAIHMLSPSTLSGGKDSTMSGFMASVKKRLARLWRADAPLTAVSLLMLPVLAACAVGLWLDPRSILGAPVWLKPAKFAASICVYGLSLAWVFSYMPTATRLKRFVGRTTALVFSIEVLIISLQAARSTTSHFNVSTPLNAALFTVMGVAIVVQTLTSVALATALWRLKLADRTLGWAFRLGLSIAILGGAVGGLMVQPTPEQLSEMKAGRVSVSGAHTVGAPDGGPGLRATGWSNEHGDLRVSHFLGLHALQALPLLALCLRRTRLSEERRVRLIWVAGGSYLSLVALLLWQALRGRALGSLDALTTGALLSWLAFTLLLSWQALRHSLHSAAPAPLQTAKGRAA
jgi:hypothetical protein